MPQSKITVVIPAKNRSNLLIRAVKSVENQSVRAQIIVVDDGSKPRLSTYIKQATNLKIIRSELSSGPAVSRNLGLKHCKTDFVAFLDSDDYWNPEFLERSINFLNQNPRTVGVMSFSHKKFEAEFALLSKFKLVALNFIKDIVVIFAYLFNRCTLPVSFVYLCQISHLVFNNSKIKGTYFDPSYKYCEDWKFILDASIHGTIGIVPKKLVNLYYSFNSNTFTQVSINAKNKDKYYHRLIAELKKRFGTTLGVKLFIQYVNGFLITRA